MKKILYILVAILLFLNWLPIAHAAVCCKCTSTTAPNNTICLQYDGAECTALPQNSVNAEVKKLTCTQTLDDGACKAVAQGGACVVGPTDQKLYKPTATGEAEPSKKVPPIVPQLGVNIPGLSFSSDLAEKGGYITFPWIAQYFSAIYSYLIGVSAVAAAVMIVWGGFLYIAGSALPQISSGKTKITNALIGLFLVLAAYTILNTVNPATTGLSPLKIQSITAQPWHGDEESDLPPDVAGKEVAITMPNAAADLGSTAVVLPKAICSGESCKDLCTGCSPKATLPEAPGIATSVDLAKIPANAPGIEGTGTLRPFAVVALLEAGRAAQGWAGGPYKIKVISTSRPLSAQVAIACQKICEGKAEQVGINVASPGGSVHGSGLAADLELWKDNKKLVSCCTVATQTTDTTEQNAKLFQEIMASVGWVRYCKEVWHFEYGTDGKPARSKSCAWPPK